MQWITDKLLAFISNDKHLFLKAYINVAFDEAVGCHQTFLKANNSPFSGLAGFYKTETHLSFVRVRVGQLWSRLILQLTAECRVTGAGCCRDWEPFCYVKLGFVIPVRPETRFPFNTKYEGLHVTN